MKINKARLKKAAVTAGITVCLLCVLWPLISNVYHELHAHVLLNTYSRQMRGMEREDLSAEWEACRTYNEELYEKRKRTEDDYLGEDTRTGIRTAAQETAGMWEDTELCQAYEARLAQDDKGVMAYVTVPAIGVSLPVYHYADEESLTSGAGHMWQSSLPVGGPSTHAAISSHTGSSRQALFSDLDQLREGDRFTIRVLDEIHEYEVDRILTVLPHETEYLEIEEGRDLVTLITCTPFGINSHRLLVRGVRCGTGPEQTGTQADPAEPAASEETGRGTGGLSTWTKHYLRAVAAGACSAGAVLAGMSCMRRHRSKNRRRRDEEA